MRLPIFNKIKEIIHNNVGKMTVNDFPKIIYIVDSIKESVLTKHPNIKDLIASNENEDTVIFVVSPVPSPYVEEGSGKMYLGEPDFNNLMPFLMEFFSSKQRGISISEAFNTLIERLTGE